MSRKRVLTGRPLEASIGFSRAIRVGARIEISGTAPTNPDGSTAGGNDLYLQAQACFAIIQAAIEELGGRLADVYRTRMLLTDPAYSEAVGRAHGELFGDIKPAATMVVVAALLNPEWLVEIEAWAEIDDSAR